jgi:hypothetical protein
MNVKQALEILDDARADAGMSMLDFLTYMGESKWLGETFTEEQVSAYRIVMRDFRKLFASKRPVEETA